MATESTEPSRADIWLGRFGASEPGELGKSRPAVIVSVDGLAVGHERDLFVVVPISATAGSSPARPAIDPAASGLDRPSVAVPRAVRAVSRTRLLRRLGQVPDDTMVEIEAALKAILGLD